MSAIEQSAPSQSPLVRHDAPSFVVVTPCRDEEDHLEANIRTMLAQTVRPTRWVIVDDGSTDRTPQILDEAARQHDFIRIVRRDDRGRRRVGPGVIEAFYVGLEAAGDLDQYEYLCKLDADLELPPRYFERLIEEMDADPFLGSVSGKVFVREPCGRLVHEKRGDEAAVGPSKFYRRTTFDDIGGFQRIVGWDGIDGHTCRLRGWVAKSIMDDELRLIHQRQMGSSDRGVLTGRVRGGRGKWCLGASPWYVLATAVYRLRDAPPVVGSLAMLWGYFVAVVTGVPRHRDPQYLRFLRRFEIECLLRGKRATTHRYHNHIRNRSNEA